MNEGTMEVTGATLATVEWRPENEARAILQIVHGMAEHVRRYDDLAKRFTARGYLVVGHDHRGHGKTATAETLGHMGPWQPVVDDVRRVGDKARADHPGIPLGVLAHSMGSFMAQQLILDAPDHADAWALSGSNGKPPAIAAAGRLVARFERWRVKPEKPSGLLQKLSFGRFNDGFEGRTEFDWLSRDPEQVDLYVDDPFCGFALSTDSWVGMLDALGPIADPYRQRQIPPELPIYILGGAEDPVSEKGAGLQQLAGAYRNAGLTDVTLDLYEGARHEILNEINRDEVIEDLMDWMDARLGLVDHSSET